MSMPVSNQTKGPALSQQRKTCQVTLGIRMPSDYAVRVATVKYNGNYALDTGVTASVSSLYFFQGVGNQVSLLKVCVEGNVLMFKLN